MGTDRRAGRDADETDAQAAHDADGTDAQAAHDADGTGGWDVGALLERARETLDRERRRTVDERDAFAEFHGRVREIRPVSAPATGPAAGGVATDTAGALSGSAGTPAADAATQRLDAVREAYRETVMGVPHFEAEYDESYAESVAEEFGPDVAAVLVAGDRFDRVYRGTLLEAVGEARSRRGTLVEALDAERESLATHRDRVRSIRETLDAVTAGTDTTADRQASADTTADRQASADTTADRQTGTDTTADRQAGAASFGDLAAAHSTLVALRDRCDAVAADRQADLRDHAGCLSPSPETVDVSTYCYQSLSVGYPVLAAVAALADRITARQRAVERAVATWS